MRNLHLLTIVHTVKSKVKILQNFVAFSEYMTLKTLTFDFDKEKLEDVSYNQNCIRVQMRLQKSLDFIAPALRLGWKFYQYVKLCNYIFT